MREKTFSPFNVIYLLRRIGCLIFIQLFLIKDNYYQVLINQKSYIV
jgi:hypothetical protein